ncbi:MAG: M20 metallopeptidase family protein [Streptomycetales bacterium]
MDLRDDARGMADELTALRHALHREPEVGLDLPRTQEKVLEAIGGLPLEVSTGRSLTSVTAVLRGGHPGPVVLLRGDMDALPVQERIDVPFRSQVGQTMHACGHDLHTTMLVGAARLLSAQREKLAGSVIFMFQPGEEGYDGARLMLEEGVLDAAGDRPVAAYALHVSSARWPQGMFATRPGPLLAASDRLSVTVRGEGGHGSAPHQAKDPVPAACEMVTALQTFLGRSIDAFDPSVLTVGTFHAGTRPNIIPDQAHFEATVRTFRPQVQDVIATGAPRVCEGIAAAHGLEVDVRYHVEYPVTVNSEEAAAYTGEVVADLFGGDRFEVSENPLTGSEDFSRVLDSVPGAMVFLGAVPDGTYYENAPYNHSPYAAFDDAVLPDGTALYAELAARRLAATA